MRIIGGRSWSASSMTSSESRPLPERGSFMVEPISANRRALRRSSSRFMTAWRMTNDIRDRPFELLVAVDPPLEVDLAEALRCRAARRRR